MNPTTFTYTFTARFPSPSGRGRDHVKRGVVSAYYPEHALRIVREHLRLDPTVDHSVRVEVDLLPDFTASTIVG